MIAGDINDDGVVNVADILLMQRHVLGFVSLTVAEIDRGDFYIVTNISATKTMMNESLKQRYDEMIDAVNSGPGSP